MNNIDRITNGGVKFVEVMELKQDPNYVRVRIVDNEGLGASLASFLLRKDHVRPVPTLVEDYMMDNFVMGPSWSWVNRGWGLWEGNFATLDNHKVSDGFRWTE